MAKKWFIDPITGKFDHHSFKFSKRAKKQAHYEIKKERMLSDWIITIMSKIQTQLSNVLQKTPVQAKKTVLHTKQKLLPALVMEQRSLRVYSFELAEIKTDLVIVQNQMRTFQQEITVVE